MDLFVFILLEDPWAFWMYWIFSMKWGEFGAIISLICFWYSPFLWDSHYTCDGISEDFEVLFSFLHFLFFPVLWTGQYLFCYLYVCLFCLLSAHLCSWVPLVGFGFFISVLVFLNSRTSIGFFFYNFCLFYWLLFDESLLPSCNSSNIFTNFWSLSLLSPTFILPLLQNTMSVKCCFELYG